MLARRPASEPPPTAPSNLGQGSALGQGVHGQEKQSALSTLEAALKDGSVGALLVVTAPRACLEAIGGHIERVLQLGGAAVVRTLSGPGGDGFRLALARLRGPVVRAVHADASNEAATETPSARDAAVEILTALSSASGARRVVVVDPTSSRFSRAVATEIEATASGSSAPLVVWVTPEPPSGVSRVIELSGQLDAAEVERWWAAAASSVVPQLRSIDALDGWWRGAKLDQNARKSDGAWSELAQALALVGRAWPEKRIGDLLPEADRGTAATLVAELVASGAAEITDAGVLAIGGDAVSDRPVDPTVARRSVTALVRVFSNDPWATFRAAEIAFSIGDTAEGDTLAQRAITAVVDGDARADFWARLAVCQPLGAAAGAKRLLAYVTLGLFTGEIDVALRFARDAASLEPDSAEVLLALGKCHAAMGDAPAALVTMQRAGERAADAVLRARIEVELAEVKYRSGDLAAAKAGAEEALSILGASTAGGDVKLDARNVIGKLLLAKAAYADAELHFTADACEAALARQPMAELRARLNRALAVLYAGRRGEAQALLESVLGDASGELVPRGFALVNLGVIATLEHRYADALDITERAAEAVLRTGDRLSFARCSANLIDLRLRLGLVSEADQALRFGLRVLKGSMPGTQVSQFSTLQARIHFARGETAQAHQSILRALADLGASVSTTNSASSSRGRGPGRELASQALRVAAHIALEDGDTARARVLVEQAEREGGPVRAHAEIALLRAQLSRSLGEPFAEQARQALEASREADDIELMRDAHLILFQAASADRDTPLARHHLSAALSYRDRMALGLPEAMRQAFFARREIATIEREAQAFEASAAVAARALGSNAGWTDAVRSVEVRGAGDTSQVRLSASERPRIVGDDGAIKSLLNAVKKVGPSDATVLIHGESGTGKELVAEALHTASGRRGGPLVKVNCAALVETLLLSELFGHEKGSFTGAAARRRGRFEAAEGGTLFLDEIGDISPRTQVALLRVLQEKTFERVGGTTPIRANVRVVCATHRNLKALVARGEFREDLYYRLCGVVLEVPALRSRLGDLGAISEAILLRIAAERGGPVKKLSSRCLGALKTYPWPGNVRELENALRAASLFAEGDVLEPEDFADNVDALRGLSS
ncbi:MAG: sigma 54-interacting transcriptional regulator, partial [Polyangiaceae bacterium]|nr:sigma 54-interacting transcriptional regulator [Polyangiaceae bacterium]